MLWAYTEPDFLSHKFPPHWLSLPTSWVWEGQMQPCCNMPRQPRHEAGSLPTLVSVGRQKEAVRFASIFLFLDDSERTWLLPRIPLLWRWRHSVPILQFLFPKTKTKILRFLRECDCHHWADRCSLLEKSLGFAGEMTNDLVTIRDYDLHVLIRNSL